MGFSRQESWSGLPFPSRGDLLDPGIEPTSLMSLALAGGSFTTEPPGKPPQPFPSHVCEGAWVPGVDTGQQDPPSLDPHWPIKYSPSHVVQTMTLHVYEVKHSVLQSHRPHFKCSVASCGQVPRCWTEPMFEKSHHHRKFYWTFHSRSLKGCRGNTRPREALHVLC